MKQEIYLDNNTTTRPSERAIAKMLPFLTEQWGVPSAPHLMGQQLYPAIDEALRGIYALAGAKESDGFVFTSSGAEAVNHAILSTYFDVTMLMGKNQFITAATDEAPAIMSIGRLEQFSCLGKMAPVNAQGQVTVQAIAETMTPRTALVSLSWANGLTGVVNPIEEIATLCNERGVWLHVDATHTLGKLFHHNEDLCAHFVSFNGDNLHAPKGTGGLFIKGDVKCSPFIVGGIEQAGHRAGCLNVAGLAALGEAAREALDARDLLGTEVARLRSHFETEILSAVPDAIVFFRDVERVPNCTAIAFPGVSNEALLYALNRRNLYASIGGGSYQQIGLLLMAAGVEESIAHSSISFSFSRETTEEQVDKAVSIVAEAVQRLRKVSQQLVKGV